MEHGDKTLTCVDCSQPFVWTAGEQAFYAEKGFTNPPKRCKECKGRRQESGGRRGPSRGPGPARVETTVKCSECGTETTVPFKPSQDRPVFCKDCFGKRSGRGR